MLRLVYQLCAISLLYKSKRFAYFSIHPLLYPCVPHLSKKKKHKIMPQGKKLQIIYLMNMEQNRVAKWLQLFIPYTLSQKKKNQKTKHGHMVYVSFHHLQSTVASVITHELGKFRASTAPSYSEYQELTKDLLS